MTASFASDPRESLARHRARYYASRKPRPASSVAVDALFLSLWFLALAAAAWGLAAIGWLRLR